MYMAAYLVKGTQPALGSFSQHGYFAEEVQSYAQACEKAARTSPRSLAERFEELARTWTRLADDLERAEALRQNRANPPLRRAG
jgi:hypothetical protein